MTILKEIQEFGYDYAHRQLVQSSIPNKWFQDVLVKKIKRIHDIELPNSEQFTNWLKEDGSDEIAITLVKSLFYNTKDSSFITQAKDFKDYGVSRVYLDKYIAPKSILELQKQSFNYWEAQTLSALKYSTDFQIPTLEIIGRSQASKEFPYFITITGQDDSYYGKSFANMRECLVVLVLLTYSRLVPVDLCKFVKGMKFEII